VYEIALVLALLVAVVGLAALARRIEVPYPILLVIGGLLLGFAPILPLVELAPEIVFMLFVPPLLVSAGMVADRRRRGYVLEYPVLQAAARSMMASFEVDFCTVAHWDNGQITQEYLFYDLVTFMKQIGLTT